MFLKFEKCLFYPLLVVGSIYLLANGLELLQYRTWQQSKTWAFLNAIACISIFAMWLLPLLGVKREHWTLRAALYVVLANGFYALFLLPFSLVW